MSTPTRSFRIGLAVLFVASSERSAQSQRPVSPEALRALLSAARYGEAEAGARAFLAEAEAVEGPDSVWVAEILQTLVEALRRGGKVRAPETKPNDLGNVHDGLGNYSQSRSLHGSWPRHGC